MKKFIAFGVGLVLMLFVLVTMLVFSLIYFQSDESDSEMGASNQEEVQVQSPQPANLESTENWATLTNLNHTLMYPGEANAEANQFESVIVFMGQKQIDSGRTQTELFDGYSVRVGTVDNPEADLYSTAVREHQNATNNCHSGQGQVTDLREISVSGQQAFQYSSTDCYIDYAETIVAYKNIIYRVSQSYSGDAEDYDNYKEITNRIVSTLTFLD